MYSILRIFISLTFLSVTVSARCTGTARYRLTIENTWTAARFGSANVPSFAHFSPLTFFSHSPRFSSLVLRGYATTGIKNVAETGDNSQLRRELNAAGDFVLDSSVSSGDADPGKSFSAIVTVDCTRNYVSAVSMIAPSPDWIIAVANFNVIRGGNFIASKKGTLKVYDAGTDSGKTLSASDKATNPVENIAPLKGAPFRGKSVANYELKKL